MDDADERPERKYPLSPGKMSKTPSWVMLGFLLGAVTVASLPSLRKKVPVPPVVAARQEPAAASPAAPREPPQLTTIEAVFEEWAKYAVWDFDTTEVALWNPRTNGFTDFFEVRRYAGTYYFRTLPALTRRVITRGKPIPECPLLFTETEEQYQEWKQHGRSERPPGDYRPLSAFRPEAPKGPSLDEVRSAQAQPPPPEALPPFELPPVKTGEPKR